MTYALVKSVVPLDFVPEPNNNFVWNGMTYTSAQLLTPEVRHSAMIFDLNYATPTPPYGYAIGANSFSIDTVLCTVTEAWSYVQLTAAQMLLNAQQSYPILIQQHIDSTAQLKGYDNIVSASSYAGFTNPFQTQGQQYVQWRGDTWQFAYTYLAEVQAGTKTLPTPAEMLALLPVCPVV